MRAHRRRVTPAAGAAAWAAGPARWWRPYVYIDSAQFATFILISVDMGLNQIRGSGRSELEDHKSKQLQADID